MNITKDKFISVTYELRTEAEGELVEKATEESPLTFINGAGQMIPKFEENLEGLVVGDKFEFKIEIIDAYGPATEEAVIDLQKNIFEVDGNFDSKVVKVGNVVPLQDNTGNITKGIVLEVTDDIVKMDFNHPLSGDDLYFKGEVIDVRIPSKEELQALEGTGGGYCDSHDHEHQHGECGCGSHKNEHKHGNGECGSHGNKHKHGNGECKSHENKHKHGNGECKSHGNKHKHRNGECKSN